MFCSISGEPPQQPVVSIKSGQLYEKRLILKYLQDNNGTEPTTGEELDAERDLVEIKTKSQIPAPRPPTFTSIPSLLSSLQNEYDSILFELVTLKKQYDATRQELAAALYTNDAANRVIARLMKERDEAREAVTSIGGTLGNGHGAAAGGGGEGDVEMADDGAVAADGPTSAVPAAIASEIDSTAARLSAQRKPKSKRKVFPEGYASSETIGSSFEQVKALSSMHSTKPPGITSMAVSSNGKWIVSGGNDKVVQIYDREEDQIVASLKGHTKPITRVVLVPPPAEVDVGNEVAGAHPAPTHVISASEDKTIRIFREEGAKWKSGQQIKGFKDVVTGLDVHPSGHFFGAASRDGSWALYDLTSGEALISVEEPADDAQGGYVYESLRFHPDGQLVAMGTAGGVIRVWDVKTASQVTVFRDGTHQGHPVSALGFSENGYYLAAACSSGTTAVNVWDLRKLSIAGTISPAAGDEQEAAVGVGEVAFDPSAQFLAVVGQDTKVYANKSWQLIKSFDGNAAQITAAAWDARDGSLLVAGLDRSVRVFAAPS